MKWRSKPLTEVADFCLGKMLDEQKNKGELRPYLANVNVRWGEFNLEDLREMRFEHDELDRYGLRYGDIVMCEGGEPGRCAIWKDPVPGMMIQKALHRIRPRECVEQRFLFYSLLHKGKTGRFAALFTGSTIKHFPREKLAKIEIEFPELEAQRQIAEVLTAYDDLIENNRRRMALLEESARLLYQEWFVRLRFPGHEHLRVIDDQPEGWESHLLDDLCLIGRGASPRPIAQFLGGDIPWFKIGDATASECLYIFETEEHIIEDGASKSVMLDPGSLILSNSATCGIPYFTAIRGCIHDGWLHFSRFKRISSEFLYCYLFFKREELVSSVSDGSTQKNLNTAAVGRLRVVVPKDGPTLRQFDDAIRPMFALILKLARQNLKLKAARDLLLPESAPHGLLPEILGNRRRLQSREGPRHNRGDLRPSRRFRQRSDGRAAPSCRRRPDRRRTGALDLLKKDNLSKADRERVKLASRNLLESVRRLVAPLERWTEKEQTQAEVEVFILDSIFESLPTPPFDDDEKQQIARLAYEHIWQQGASGAYVIGAAV